MKWSVTIDTTLVFRCEVEGTTSENACDKAMQLLVNKLASAGLGTCPIDTEIAECEELSNGL